MKTPSEVVQAARNAFNTGRTLKLDFRELQMKNLLRMIDENEKEILEVLKKDLNKSEQEGLLTEVLMCRNEIKSLMNSFKRWAQPEKVSTGFVNLLDTAVIYKDPYGVVLVISPWNYPILLAIQPLVGALAAGNAVVLKPSEIAPATADFLARKIPEYLNDECYHVMCGGVSETTQLLAQRFDYIFFTGSSDVGHVIYTAASKHLTPVTLELGGKNPLFLDEDVDMDVATRRILWGKCINAGQTCLAPDYVLCSKSVQKVFLEKAKEVLTEWYGENPQYSGDFARIVNDRHFARISKLLDPSKVAIGGKVDERDLYIEPTIMINVRVTDPVMKEEIFGPLLPIINVTDVDQAVDFINAGEKPLAIYIFSNREQIVNTLLNNTSSGGACVNDTITHIAVRSLPFGGVGYSGMGAYHGRYTLDTFVHKKGVLMRNLGELGEKLQRFRYPPYSQNKIRWLRHVLKPASTDTESYPYSEFIIPFVLGVTSLYMLRLFFSFIFHKK